MLLRSISTVRFNITVAIPLRQYGQSSYKTKSTNVIQLAFAHGLSTSTKNGSSLNAEHRSQIIKAVSKLLSCQEIDVLNIYKIEPLLEGRGLATVKQRMDYLMENQVSATSILEHPFLLVNRK